MSSLCLLLMLLPLVATQTLQWGPCPTPKVQPGFDIRKYMGKWYEIEKLPAWYEPGKCLEANYSLRKDGSIEVYNTQIYQGKMRSGKGTAVARDLREAAKLGVSFSYFTPYSPYWVLSTDYTYSVVYSCNDVLRLFHIDFAWILSRSRFLPKDTVKRAKDLMVSEGIDLSRMKPTDQTGCGDD